MTEKTIGLDGEHSNNDDMEICNSIKKLVDDYYTITGKFIKSFTLNGSQATITHD